MALSTHLWGRGGGAVVSTCMPPRRSEPRDGAEHSRSRHQRSGPCVLGRRTRALRSQAALRAPPPTPHRAPHAYLMREAIRCNQVQSGAIRCNQVQSEAHRAPHAHCTSRPPPAISCNQLQSVAIRCNYAHCTSRPPPARPAAAARRTGWTRSPDGAPVGKGWRRRGEHLHADPGSTRSRARRTSTFRSAAAAACRR
jgi:hypothetical protein